MDSQNIDTVIPDTEQVEKKKHRNPFNVQQRKDERDKRRQKRARLIIRNISYKVTDENLKKHFDKYGEIIDLNILKKPDGKLVGCAFVQYEKVNEAAKAIVKTNNKSFLGRPIYVDWALGKNEYDRKRITTKVEVKTENIEKSSNNDDSIKTELDELIEIKNDESDDEFPKKVEEEMETDDSNNESEDDEADNKEDVKIEIKEEKEHDKKISNDVKEGCTIFIKNVPFDASNNDLRKVCRKYGPVYYVIINTDPISKHSKGTAFVKFKTKESADLCLKAGEEFNLMNSVMEPFPALSRQDLNNKNNKNFESDSRNLYLVKEGLIMTGSNAALGVSTADIAKRHKLEQMKASVLKDLNRFVSRNRLSIHNLPPTYDDDKLKTLIIKHTQLKPHECRVMTENKPSPGYPKGKSKGFGFMSFSTHLDALNALRKLNNNPDVFGATNRPIVSFSIEDRSVHNIKGKRLEKSRQNNPTYQKKLEKVKERKQKKRNNRILQKDNKSEIQKIITNSEGNKKSKNKSITNNDDLVTDQTNNEFVGMPAKPGSFVRMRSNKKIRQQSMEHKKKISEVKRKQKKQKEKRMHRMERKEIDRTKIGKPKSEKDNFSILVNKYKNLVDSNAEKQDKSNKKAKRTKWYVD